MKRRAANVAGWDKVRWPFRLPGGDGLGVGSDHSRTGTRSARKNCESLVNRQSGGCIFSNLQVELGREAYHLRSGG